MRVYDEGRIAQSARALDRFSRTAFAAACAERLWPLVERYASVMSVPTEGVRVLRQSLDAAWSAACGEDIDLRHARETAEEMVPYEDDDWVMEAGYAQNAIAAIAYATRSWLTDDPQEAVWAARQVYEAADYGAQQSQLSGEKVYSAVVEEALANAPVVQAAVRAIFDDLEAAEVDSAEALHERALTASVDFARLFP